MPSVEGFKSLGYWPSCVANGVTISFNGEEAFVDSTAITSLLESMKIWWLLDEVEIDYDVSLTYVINNISYPVNLSGSKIINVATAPKNRVCFSNNVIVLEPSSAGEMMPVNTDDLALYYLLDTAGTNNPDIGTTYSVALVLTSFTTPLNNGISPDIGSVASGGFQGGLHYQILYSDIVPDSSAATLSCTGITFFTTT